jgi:hypothetical protein
MSTGEQTAMDEAKIQDLIERWAGAVRARNFDGISGQSLPGDVDVRRPAVG